MIAKYLNDFFLNYDFLFCWVLVGQNNEVKKNIRKFNGFPFEKDSKDYEKKNDQLVK